jgi:glycosyltransferase involved in cell wall biosynthesis
VLISTIAPLGGGVPTMTGFVVNALRKRGFEPVLAHYEPYSVSPALSVPLTRILRGQVGSANRTTIEGCETHAIGAWLPELEFTHYLATDYWRELMENVRACVVVSGNALSALPFYQTARSYVAWIASGWTADREHRVQNFSATRSAIDRTVVGPVARQLERAILNRGCILSLSQYTRRTLDGLAGRTAVRDVLPMPIDTDLFSPQPESRVRGRVGFSGRFDDPRKNIGLLLDALALLRNGGHQVSALIVGGEPTAAIRSKIAACGIGDDVKLLPYGTRQALRDHLRTLDLFVVPSHQEGLCIAALEAMSCGLPVVSTRCGGPEEFVFDNETGYLVEFDTAEMANAIVSIVGDRLRRERLGAAARDLVLRHYSTARSTTVFWNAFDATFPGVVKEAA